MVDFISYLIWTNRNKMIFNKVDGVLVKCLFDMQIKTFEWLNGKTKDLSIEWSIWLTEPRVG